MKVSRTLRFPALVLLLAGISACSFLNSFQSEGTLVLPGLKAPVTVHRDEKGMAYIYVQDLHDAVMAQGFVTAQDRLFQMELTRLVARGRICEMAGEEARPLAIQTKTIGFLRNAKKHAALKTAGDLGSSLGKDPSQWHWGKVHQMEFVSPIRRRGFGKELLGGGSYPAPGSCETLYRGIYDFKEPFSVTVSASLRMVVDLNDEDKILAVLPGGVCGRLFHPHTKDQVEAFMNGDKVYWWFSDRAIKEHSRAVLRLTGM